MWRRWMPWMLLFVVIVPAWSTVAAQEVPALTAEQRVMVELNNEVERLANDLQLALDQIVALQSRVNVLTRAYNSLRLSLVRERSTPAVEGFTFDWTLDGDSRQRRGLVPVPPEDDPGETSDQDKP